jgi:hypothetical protein
LTINELTERLGGVTVKFAYDDGEEDSFWLRPPVTREALVKALRAKARERAASLAAVQSLAHLVGQRVEEDR